jgi:O-antigen/teichoic acid export membrane protein
MAWGAVISNAVLAALTIWQRPASMLWRPSLNGARDVIKFGVHSSSQQMMHEMISGAPDLALGKLAGFHDVGLYSRANGLAQVLGGAVLRGLWPVVLPYFSSAMRQEKPLREPFKDLTAAVLGLCWPILAVAALQAGLAPRAFGPPWVEATNALRLLLAAMAVSVLFTLAPQALTAAGAISAVSRIVAWTVVPRLLVIVGGALAGLEAAAGGVLLSNLIFSAALFSVLADRIGLKWIDVGHLVFRNLALVAFSVALPALVYWYMPQGASAMIDEASLRLVLAGLGATIGFATGLVRTRHPLLDLVPKAAPYCVYRPCFHGGSKIGRRN